MRNADGTDMTKAQVLIKRRGAFKWLPALFSNDLVHGSWWFVAGSAAMTLFALVPLCQQYIPFYEQHDDLLPSADFTVTWTLMVFSGFFFTLGSAAFVRAFAEPTKQPLFWYNKHFQTDELLGAWMFLWGTVPGVPYTLVFFIVDPTSVFLGAVGISIVMVMGSLLFVVACYPSDKVRLFSWHPRGTSRVPWSLSLISLSLSLSIFLSLIPIPIAYTNAHAHRNATITFCRSVCATAEPTCGLSSTWPTTGWPARGSF